MRTRSIVLSVMLAVLAIWLIVNRQLFSLPVDVSLFVTTVSTSLGAVLLGTLALLTLGFVVYIAISQGAMLRDYRAQTRELETQRRLADDAEASRFTELAGIVRTELVQLEQRIGGHMEGLRTELRETESAVSATLGEMQDRLERTGSVPSDVPLLEAPNAAAPRPRWFSR